MKNLSEITLVKNLEKECWIRYDADFSSENFEASFVDEHCETITT